MNDYERTVDYGFAMGQDAGMLRELGATDAQVRSYIYFHIGQIRHMHRQAYLAAARRGFTQYSAKFAKPIYAVHKANLEKFVKHGAACLELVVEEKRG